MAKSGASLEEIHQQAAEEETQKSAQKLAEKELRREAKAAAQAEKEGETVKGKLIFYFFTVVTLVHILNKCTHSELFHQLFISQYYSVAPASYFVVIFFNIFYLFAAKLTVVRGKVAKWEQPKQKKYDSKFTFHFNQPPFPFYIL